MRMSRNFSTTKQTSMLPNRLMSTEMVKAIMKPPFKKLSSDMSYRKEKKISGTSSDLYRWFPPFYILCCDEKNRQSSEALVYLNYATQMGH